MKKKLSNIQNSGVPINDDRLGQLIEHGKKNQVVYVKLSHKKIK